MAESGAAILGIQTSPNLDGLTATLTHYALKGAAESGADSTLLNLRKMDIRACLACNSGWGSCRAEGSCAQADDFNQVKHQIEESKALVFATPVYFGDVSEVARCFLDRLRRCEVSFRHDSKINGKPVVGIAAAGGSGAGVNAALRTLERYFKWLQLNVVDMFAVTPRNTHQQKERLLWAGRDLAQHPTKPPAPPAE